MNVYRINPLADSRWPRFVETHPRASVFHTTGWLSALQRTYGYEPVAFTTSVSDRELTSALVFCRVSTWLTAKRLVSLPFSDHCEPLVDDERELDSILAAVQSDAEREGLRYVELRPRNNPVNRQWPFRESATFHFHMLDLQPSLDELFAGFHKSCVQRKIRRAEREGLLYEEGRSDLLLSQFYTLYLGMRRRHGVPPQPIRWFYNLIQSLGESVKIRVASKDGRPVAGILTLSYKQSLVYKYGCSDLKFNHLGGMHFLMWKAIQEARNRGFRELDMGRADQEDSGLATFKDRWNCTRSIITYWKYPARTVEDAGPRWSKRASKQVFAHLPNGALAAAGRLLYKHIG